MANKYVFLRHALTIVDFSKPANQWILSKEGIEKIERVSRNKYFDDVDIIAASTEQKAIDTASFVSKRIGKDIITFDELKELERGKPLNNIDSYENSVKLVLERKGTNPKDWETADNALFRFKNVIENFDSSFEGKKILVVSHGLVLTLYFGDLLDTPRDQLFNRWKKLDFCSWGVVENKKVTKDII
jgi:broad specificity phosphatase PhoE